MPQPERIAPKAQSTPPSFGGRRKTARAIPDDLLKEASRRLEIMSLLGAVLWAVASILWHLRAGSTTAGRLHFSEFKSSDVIAVIATVASLAMFVYARRTKRDPRFIL